MRFDPFIRLLCPHLAEIPWLALFWLNYTLNNLQLATAFMPVDFAQLYLKSHFLKTWSSDTTLKLTDVCLLSWLLKTLPSITAFRHSMCFRTFAFFCSFGGYYKIFRFRKYNLRYGPYTPNILRISCGIRTLPLDTFFMLPRKTLQIYNWFKSFLITVF